MTDETDDQPTPSIADTLRHHGITPCSRCHGEGIIKAKTELLEQTAQCGRCDGTGEEPKCAECGGTERVYREVRDDEGVFMRDPDGRVPFPCACVLAREGVAPDVGNNVSMDRAKPGDGDMKGKTHER